MTSTKVSAVTRNRVPLARALSKLGVLSRAQATAAIRAGRVRVDGRIVRDPLNGVDPDRSRLVVDGHQVQRAAWRTILLHKPRGVVTSRCDPEGRRTVFDVVGDEGHGLVPVGRLDLATSGLLLLTSDTQLAHWIVTRLKRIKLGGLDLGTLAPGQFRELSPEEVEAAFPL